MLETEISWFNEHREALLKDYPNRFVVIKGNEFVGDFDTIQNALSEAARRFGAESFLVRRVDQTPETVSVPALTLGLLNADPSSPVSR